jgi:hypothetical protein
MHSRQCRTLPRALLLSSVKLWKESCKEHWRIIRAVLEMIWCIKTNLLRLSEAKTEKQAQSSAGWHTFVRDLNKHTHLLVLPTPNSLPVCAYEPYRLSPCTMAFWFLFLNAHTQSEILRQPTECLSHSSPSCKDCSPRARICLCPPVQLWWHQHQVCIYTDP